jgi:hypothetical protein
MHYYYYYYYYFFAKLKEEGKSRLHRNADAILILALREIPGNMEYATIINDV